MTAPAGDVAIACTGTTDRGGLEVKPFSLGRQLHTFHLYSTNRDIDHALVEAPTAEAPFKKLIDDQPLTSEERKAVEDHLFWYSAAKSRDYGLPVKIHTGYYAGENAMPLARVSRNPGSACDLCRAAPDTTFVFMHICYPYYEELITVAKQYTLPTSTCAGRGL